MVSVDLGFEFDPAAVQTQYTTHGEPRIAFTDLLLEHGFHGFNQIVPDWSLQRIKDSADKPNSKSKTGWYLYSEFAEDKTGATIGLGVFGSWRGNPEKVVWCSKKTNNMTETERRAYLERLERARQDREATIKERQALAVSEVALTLAQASNTAAKHAYAMRKDIVPKSSEAKVVSADADQYAGWLVVPVTDCDDESVFSSAQYISQKGDKYFHSGGKVKGCYSILNGDSDYAFFVVEGFATGQTVRDATGCTVYVAFNAGNLADVAAHVRAKYPLAKIVIAGDNDHESKVGNTGKHAAEAAALICGGSFVIPPDHAGETDWNDFVQRCGIAKAADLLIPAPETVDAPLIPDDNDDSALAGLVKMTLDWIELNSFYPQPELSLLNVIAALGAVCGRRYRLEDYGTRTNIYTLGIAPTGMGKDNSRQRVKELMRLSGLQEFIGSDEIRSGPGLLDHIVQKPSMVYQIDEFGMFLKSMASANTAGYAQTIPAILTKLYSSSSSSYETGNLKGDDGLPPSIQEPCLSIYGTTTEEVYAEAMRASAIASGELNRYIIKQSRVSFPELNKTMRRTPPTDALLRAWSALKPVVGKEPVIISLGMMRDRLIELREYQRNMQIELHEEGLDGIFARYFENTMKIASILSVARNYKEPILEEDILQFAANTVEQSLRFVLDFARDKMFENEDQRKCNKVVEYLKKSGGQATRREVMRVLHLSAKEMTAIEETLGFETGNGKIVFDKNAKPMIYRLLR